MSRVNVEIVRRSFEHISEGRPAWELYAEDFQLVNLPDAPWQPSPGHKGCRSGSTFRTMWQRNGELTSKKSKRSTPSGY
jgi:hypothetical protein